MISAEHVSPRERTPLNLKEFIRELPIPVVVGGCASAHRPAPMRTGAAACVGVGPGAACTTRGVLGHRRPAGDGDRRRAPRARLQHMLETGDYVKVIADGGMRNGGDVAQGDRLRRRRGDDRFAAGPGLRGPGRGSTGAWRRSISTPRARRARADRPERDARGDPRRPRARERRHVQPHRRPAHPRWPRAATGHRGVQPRGADGRAGAADRGQAAAALAAGRHGSRGRGVARLSTRSPRSAPAAQPLLPRPRSPNAMAHTSLRPRQRRRWLPRRPQRPTRSSCSITAASTRS